MPLQENRSPGYDKIHLFSFRRAKRITTRRAGLFPGNPSRGLKTDLATLGLSICYDLRFPELYRALGEVDLILVPSAFTLRTTGQAH